MRQRAQHHGIGIALPDYVDVTGLKVDRFALVDTCRDVVQHAIAHVDSVVEPDDAAGRVGGAREILEDVFARGA